ncbi:50S ribosomal protein L30 [Candidatus Woesearchaeota archaeon]|nr:50S ribosomal protein L30 [Candidatus Woesearchaeota archaeon]
MVESKTKVVEKIKKLQSSDKLVIGTKNTQKHLVRGGLEAVYLSKNAPSDVKEMIERYAKISNTKVLETSIPNDELGILCKKSFLISVLGEKK